MKTTSHSPLATSLILFLLLLGCGGDQGDLPDLFSNSSSEPSSSGEGGDSSSSNIALSSSLLSLSSSSLLSLSSSSGAGGNSSSSTSSTSSACNIVGDGVVIGTQTWSKSNIAVVDWQTAKTICPAGWHLPTMVDWSVLLQTWVPTEEDIDGIRASETAGEYLSTGCWNSNGNGSWWTDTEDILDARFAYNVSLFGKEAFWHSDPKVETLSVRCVKDRD